MQRKTWTHIAMDLGNLLDQHGYPQHVSARWLNAVCEADPSILWLIDELLSTGSQMARDAVIAQMIRNLVSFRSAHRPEATIQTSHGSLPPRLNNNLTAAWTAGNVKAEFDGIPESHTTEYFASSLLHLESYLQPIGGEYEARIDKEYWRGIAVLVLVQMEVPVFTRDQKIAASRFAKLPGGHPDLQREIDLIDERSSYDADLISDLLQQSAKIASSSLREGIL
jgi:hypothetical protein